MAFGAIRSPMCVSFLFLGLALRAVAQVHVMAPNWLVQQRENIIGATSMFGAPFYGDRIVGRLVYGASKGNSWCEADDYEVPDHKQATASTSESKARIIDVFLVRRGGGCSLRHKVRIASEKGAHAVIIADKEDSKLTTKDMPNIIVSSNGVYTGEVHIPSILISKEDGKLLIDAAQHATVIVGLAWTVPTDKSVRMDMWMSSASVETMQFLKSFAPKRRVLNRAMNFVPHYSVFRMENADPTTSMNLCSDSSGKFCAEDPDGNGPITGRMVLEEDVRQLCIHDKYKRNMDAETPGEGQSPTIEYAAEYWDYIERYIERCPLAGAGDHFGEECSKKLMVEVGIDQTEVEDCVRRTSAEKLKHEVENTAWSPRALRINGWRYSGILEAELVTKAVCSGFTVEPAVCQEISKERDPFVPYQQQVGSGISFTTLISWLLGTLVVGCVSMLLYKRRLQAEMRASIREEVMLEVQAQYSKLAGK